MGRDARTNMHTIPDVIKNTPGLPRRLRFYLLHPTLGCVACTFGFLLMIPKAAAIGVRELWAEYTRDVRMFYAIARGRDAHLK